ncbi:MULTISPECIES: ABC transporter permease [unclassified Streptomyces]|uniref:ABC transporter permease n=1 Tax=unclassified Streptomyces TaxID=2593676 RepID=UPI00215651D3|nr:MULTISPECIES: ABC transporter permease [unclassified Streptomyces]
MDVRDLWAEALAGVMARPTRSALTTLGTVLGITTLVVTIGISSTAGNQIVGRFDALTATSVTVGVPSVKGAGRGPLVDWPDVDAVRRLAGVESVAAVSESERTASVEVRANDVVAPGEVSGRTMAVVAAFPALPDVVRGGTTAGRFFDDGDIARHDRVAVLGDQAARLLGIGSVEDAPAVFLKAQTYTVIGTLGSVEREQRLAIAAILPPTTAADRMGPEAVTRVLSNTSLGAADQAARQAPVALAPGAEASLTVTAPADPAKAGTGVQGDVNGLFWSSAWSPRWSGSSVPPM